MKPIPTHVARADWGSNRFRGRSVEDELAGKVSYVQSLVLGVTGRRVSAEVAQVIDDFTSAMLVADPRIWPCKVARLGATRGSPVAGFAAGLLAQEGDGLGGWAMVHAARYFVDVAATVPAGDAQALEARVDRDLAAGHRFLGFGVPLRPRDERVDTALRCLRMRGRQGGRCITVAVGIGELLLRKKALPLNVGGAYAAALVDLGFTPEEVPLLITLSLVSPLVANAVEGAEQRSEVLAELPPECVEYKGPKPRRSPRFRGPP